MAQKDKKNNLQGKAKSVQKSQMDAYIKEKRRNIRGMIAKGFIVGVLCIMSTYAWFTTQKDITIYNLRGTVEVVESMEISLDAKSWHHKINLAEVIEGSTVLQEAVKSRDNAYGGNKVTAPNIEPTELLPVSTVGGIGKSYMPLYKGEATSRANSTRLRSIGECVEINADNTGKDNGYFAFDIYIKNTSRDDEPDVLQLNLNSAVQVLTEPVEKNIIENGVTGVREYIGQAFSGVQNSVRVALALYEDNAPSIATQKEVLDATKVSNIEKIAIWEPNAPHHVQYVVDNNNKLTGSKAVTFEDGDAITTYALTSTALTQQTINNVFNTDDSALGEQVTLQTEMTSQTEGDEDYRILSTDGKPYNLKDTDGDDFTIPTNTISRLRVYVWLEGQDVDCINLASLGGGIEVDLGLTKDDSVGTVLEDDDDDIDNQNTNTNN